MSTSSTSMPMHARTKHNTHTVHRGQTNGEKQTPRQACHNQSQYLRPCLKIPPPTPKTRTTVAPEHTPTCYLQLLANLEVPGDPSSTCPVRRLPNSRPSKWIPRTIAESRVRSLRAMGDSWLKDSRIKVSGFGGQDLVA